MSKHTPGEWIIGPSKIKYSLELETYRSFSTQPVVDENGALIAVVCGLGWSTEPKNPMTKHARLIAAAPDLLAALKRMEEADRKQAAGETYDFSNAVLEARAAIAKAEGQS